MNANRCRVKSWVDIGMAIAFLLASLTVIFKWPGLTPQIISRTANPENFYLVARIHDWSGIVMALFVFIHLFLNRDWIRSVIFCRLEKRKECKKCEIKNTWTEE